MASKHQAYVVGVGMTKFEKPGRRSWDYPDMAKEAGQKALADAGIAYSDVKQVTVGYVYGDSCCGQRAVYEIGLSGVPVYNVNNNCSTGSTALFMAKQLVEGGIADCVLALGFEKMERGSLKNKYDDRTNPISLHMETMLKLKGYEPTAPPAPQLFGNAGLEHMSKYGTTQEQFAKVAMKNHRHSALNPYSQFRDVYQLDGILKSPKVYGPLTRLQCCPTSEGAAAAVICNEEFARKHKLTHQAVAISGMAMTTDYPSSFSDSCITLVGTEMTRRAAEAARKQAGITPNDVQVIELHDCFSTNELVTYEALGLCPAGKGGALIDSGDVTFGGKWVVNPSGGLISKGHPLGATGLAQCAELCWQLRSMCGKRQVPNVKNALQHNLGLGGAAVVAIYKLGFPEDFRPFPAGKVNPAIDENCGSSPSLSPAVANGTEFKADVIFPELKKGIEQDSGLVGRINGIYQFNITGPGGATKSWTVDLKNAPGSVSEGKAEKADCNITISDDDFLNMVTGKANGQQLFMGGKLKIQGNMMFAMKLEQIFKKKASL